ncbi:copper fist DNA binding domain-containing protein [Mycena vulgaris]|nr:copper fist DNA binding domain-containing protein [Mycena vulgaris]
MVFVNDKKFACEACIKGHRTSTCSHSDRPLFEVAKKGRPTSQCANCRELRRSKRHHSKCVCPRDIPSRGTLLPSSSAKTRRYIANEPALPNGLRDTLQPSHSYSPPDERQKVGSLLNPCKCDSGRKCKPRAGAPHPPTPPPGPTLAPMLISAPTIRSPSKTPPIPLFGTQLPPMQIMTSLAGSGCTCGVECICPGCVEHRGPIDAAASGRHNCADGCGMCTDSRSEIVFTLPSNYPTNSMDRFLARAAALPAPPANRMEMVILPKLECCGGRCPCPDGTCECGKSCDGSCQDQEKGGAPGERDVHTKRTAPRSPQKNSCCAA